MPVFTWRKDSKDRREPASATPGDPRASGHEEFRRNGSPNAVQGLGTPSQQLKPSSSANGRPGTSRLSTTSQGSGSPFLNAAANHARDRAATSAATSAALYRAASSRSASPSRISSARNASPGPHGFNDVGRPSTAAAASSSKQQLGAYQLNRPPSSGSMGMAMQDLNVFSRYPTSQAYGMTSSSQPQSPTLQTYGIKTVGSMSSPSARTTSNRPGSRYGLGDSGGSSGGGGLLHRTSNELGSGFSGDAGGQDSGSGGHRHAWHDGNGPGSLDVGQPHSPQQAHYASPLLGGNGSGRLLASFGEGGGAHPLGLPPQSPSRAASSLKFMPRSSSARQEQHSSLLATLMVQQVGGIDGSGSPTHTASRSLAFSPAGQSSSSKTRKASGKPVRSIGSAGKASSGYAGRPGAAASSSSQTQARTQAHADHLLQRRFSTGSVAGQQWSEHIGGGDGHGGGTGAGGGVHYPPDAGAWAAGAQAGGGAGGSGHGSRLAEGTLTCIRPSTTNASNFALAFAAESQLEFSSAMQGGTPQQGSSQQGGDEPVSPGAWGAGRPQEWQPQSGSASGRNQDWPHATHFTQPTRPQGPSHGTVGSPTKSGRSITSAVASNSPTHAGVPQVISYSSSKGSHNGPGQAEPLHPSEWPSGSRQPHQASGDAGGNSTGAWGTPVGDQTWASSGVGASSGHGSSEAMAGQYPSDVVPQQSSSVDEPASHAVLMPPGVLGEHLKHIRTKPRQQPQQPPQPNQQQQQHNQQQQQQQQLYPHHGSSQAASAAVQSGHMSPSPTSGGSGSYRPGSGMAAYERPTTPAGDHGSPGGHHQGAVQGGAWAAHAEQERLTTPQQAGHGTAQKAWQTLSPPASAAAGAAAHHTPHTAEKQHEGHQSGTTHAYSSHAARQLAASPQPHAAAATPHTTAHSPTKAATAATAATSSTSAQPAHAAIQPKVAAPAAAAAAAVAPAAAAAAAAAAVDPKASDTSTNPLHMFASLASKKVPVYPPRLPNATEESNLLSGHLNADHTAALPGYAVGKVIGEGGFCQVRLAVHKLSGRRVAVKVIDKVKLADAAEARRIQREIRVMRHLSHECVVKLFEVVDAPTILYLVMEHAPSGSLLDYVRSRKRLAEPDAVTVVQQVVAGLAYCHQREVVHRDIKLENILLDTNNCMKLIDFGLSAFFIPGKQLRVHCGSPSYAAPEIVSRKHYDGPPVDVWSLGVVLFAMLAGHLPFHSSSGNKQELCAKIIEGRYNCPDHVSAHAKDLLSRMLCVDPGRRISLEQMASHPWLTSGTRWEALGASVYMVRVDPSAGLVYADEQLVMELEAAGYTRQVILQYLLSGDANYITAAYFLMAEGKAEVLRRMRGASAAQRYIARGAPTVSSTPDLMGAPMPITSTGGGGATTVATAVAGALVAPPKLMSTGHDKGMVHGGVQLRTGIPAAIPT